MRSKSRGWAGAVGVLGVLFAAAPARADLTKAQCIDANGKGQDLVHDGKLTAARAQLQACAVRACPAVISGDCTKRLDELERIQPAVTFQAKDASGNDLGGVSVTVDGVKLADRLDGTPLKVDPGEHAFVFTAPGQAPMTKNLVLAVGDTHRIERISLVSEAAPASAPASTPPPVTAPAPAAGSDATPSNGSPLRTVGLVGGIVGLAGLGVGGVFGILASSAWNSAQKECPSHEGCSPKAISDRNGASSDASLSTVALIAGGVLAAAGAVVFFTAPSGDGPTVGLTMTPGGGALVGAF